MIIDFHFLTNEQISDHFERDDINNRLTPDVFFIENMEDRPSLSISDGHDLMIYLNAKFKVRTSTYWHMGGVDSIIGTDYNSILKNDLENEEWVKELVNSPALYDSANYEMIVDGSLVNLKDQLGQLVTALNDIEDIDTRQVVVLMYSSD